LTLAGSSAVSDVSALTVFETLPVGPPPDESEFEAQAVSASAPTATAAAAAMRV
jgi:hypothetical protein